MADEEDDDIPTAPFWMATFSDMATLLLTFFILIVAMSSVEVKKFKEALSFFHGRTGVLTNESVVPSSTPMNTVVKAAEDDAGKDANEQARERAETYEELVEQLAAEGVEDGVQVNMTERGMHVIITDSVMFRSGNSELLPPSRKILRTIADVMSRREVQSVLVEGHTDDRPIRTARFPSNWELSAARAGSVVRFLLEQSGSIPAEHYMAVGHGEFKPLASNATSEGRNRNRRVEILYSWKTWQTNKNPIPTPQPTP